MHRAPSTVNDQKTDILLLLTALANALATPGAKKYKSIHFLAANQKVLLLVEKIFQNGEPEIIDFLCAGFLS